MWWPATRAISVFFSDSNALFRNRSWPAERSMRVRSGDWVLIAALTIRSPDALMSTLPATLKPASWPGTPVMSSEPVVFSFSFCRRLSCAEIESEAMRFPTLSMRIFPLPNKVRFAATMRPTVALTMFATSRVSRPWPTFNSPARVMSALWIVRFLARGSGMCIAAEASTATLVDTRPLMTSVPLLPVSRLT